MLQTPVEDFFFSCLLGSSSLTTFQNTETKRFYPSVEVITLTGVQNYFFCVCCRPWIRTSHQRFQSSFNLINGTVINSKWFSLLADTAMFMTLFFSASFFFNPEWEMQEEKWTWLSFLFFFLTTYCTLNITCICALWWLTWCVLMWQHSACWCRTYFDITKYAIDAHRTSFSDPDTELSLSGGTIFFSLLSPYGILSLSIWLRTQQ